jgi:hypothetical protein
MVVPPSSAATHGSSARIAWIVRFSVRPRDDSVAVTRSARSAHQTKSDMIRAGPRDIEMVIEQHVRLRSTGVILTAAALLFSIGPLPSHATYSPFRGLPGFFSSESLGKTKAHITDDCSMAATCSALMGHKRVSETLQCQRSRASQPGR